MSILEEAAAVVADRRPKYKHPAEGYAQLARLWSVELGIEIDAQQVVRMMILLKCSREKLDHQRDNLVDIAGYAQNLQDIIDHEEQK